MPTPPKTAGAAAAKYKFATFDEMVAESIVKGPDGEPIPEYEIPFADGSKVVIPCPDADRYIDITRAQRTGDADLMLRSLVPDERDRAFLRAKMRGAHFGVLDTMTGKVLTHYFGLTQLDQADEEGNSSAS